MLRAHLHFLLVHEGVLLYLPQTSQRERDKEREIEKQGGTERERKIERKREREM
jgi:hypothetical protein